MPDTTPGDRRGNADNLRKAVAKRAIWGTPGDFTRCLAFLRSKGVPDGKAKRICADWHHEKLGIYPGHHGGKNPQGPG